MPPCPSHHSPETARLWLSIAFSISESAKAGSPCPHGSHDPILQKNAADIRHGAGWVAKKFDQLSMVLPPQIPHRVNRPRIVPRDGRSLPRRLGSPSPSRQRRRRVCCPPIPISENWIGLSFGTFSPSVASSFMNLSIPRTKIIHRRRLAHRQSKPTHPQNRIHRSATASVFAARPKDELPSPPSDFRRRRALL